MRGGLPKVLRAEGEGHGGGLLAEVNSDLDLLTHSILRILAPRYRRVKCYYSTTVLVLCSTKYYMLLVLKTKLFRN